MTEEAAATLMKTIAVVAVMLATGVLGAYVGGRRGHAKAGFLLGTFLSIIGVAACIFLYPWPDGKNDL
jgi:hypothetical protein